MLQRILVCIVFAFNASLAWGQIEIEKYNSVAVVQVKTDFELDSTYRVSAKSKTCTPRSIATGIFIIEKPGKHLLDVDILSFKHEVWESQLIEVNVGASPDVKPDEPDIKPDDPDEPDRPTSLTNPKVLFVNESGKQMELPPSQLSILFAKKVRDYLKEKDIDWLRIDPDSKVPDDNEFKELSERNRESTPWMVIAGDEGVGFEGPLSPNVEAFLRTVDQYLKRPNRSVLEKAATPKPVESQPQPVQYMLQQVPVSRVRRVPRSRMACRIVNGIRRCFTETYYEEVTETVYESRYVEVAQ